MSMNLMNEYTMRIAIIFFSSLFFGFGHLKTYDLFRSALKENNRFKLWWAFTSLSFYFTLVVYVFGNIF